MILESRKKELELSIQRVEHSKADNLAKSKAYTAKNPFERLGRQFARSNEGSGLFGLNIVKGHALADMAKRHYADKDEKARVKRVSDFKKACLR